MFGIEETRAHFPRSFHCQTQTEMKNGISDIRKAIAQHLGERTRSRLYPITHTATTLQSTFALIAVRAVLASAYMIFVRKTFGFASFSSAARIRSAKESSSFGDSIYMIPSLKLNFGNKKSRPHFH